MIISEPYKFIFVHIPKTAGMSVTEAFGQYGRSKKGTLLRRISRRAPIRESAAKVHFRYHDPARLMEKKLGKACFAQFLSFSVIRDPFDHAVSHYEYMKQFRIKKIAEKVSKLSFVEYLEYRQEKAGGDDTIFARLPGQLYYLTDDHGEIIVNRLIRFEDLSSELTALAEELKLPNFQLLHRNKTKSKTDRKPYRSYYQGPAEEMVRKIYADDFVKLGYKNCL